ncbi:CLUMA_CG000604, isoform A [Clunio marinus]|uniref:CLUMA_CG000604, isoform A n=1 Tax=Clunio marinus TaxID=568069 RepID=A0A1J1HH79_9DIPT|nr:CLUMA_CG000604, isoform A [Clunio marinus]
MKLISWIQYLSSLLEASKRNTVWRMMPCNYILATQLFHTMYVYELELIWMRKKSIVERDVFQMNNVRIKRLFLEPPFSAKVSSPKSALFTFNTRAKHQFRKGVDGCIIVREKFVGIMTIDRINLCDNIPMLFNFSRKLNKVKEKWPTKELHRRRNFCQMFSENETDEQDTSN